MSNRAERRAADRAANRLAFRQLRHDEANQKNTSERRATSDSSTSEAQVQANQANAQKSTGPTTAEGKATVSQNRRSHGLTGQFQLQLGESQAVYDAFVDEVYAEYKPQTGTETRLAESLIQHYWLVQRAIRLQDQVLGNDDKKLALYLRYQTTHERSYYKAQKELQRLQKERTREQIGFESQNRKREAEEAKTRLDNAKAARIETENACRQMMEVPLPGNTKIGFEQLTNACSEAIAALVHVSSDNA